MNSAAQRSIVRWLHVICSVPIVGYIYSPFDVIPDYAPATRFLFFPLMLLSGHWMWKGQALRRAFVERIGPRGDARRPGCSNNGR
jgi:hypothetical protein